jgi:hypothetical protein
MLKALRRVGAPPGTTTLVLGNHLVNCSADMARGNPGQAVDLSWLHALPPSEQGCIPICVGPTAPSSSAKADPTIPRAPATALVPSAPRAVTSSTATNAPRRAYSPYGTFEDLRGGGLRGALRGALGIILNPFGKLSPFPSEIATNRQSYGAGYCGPFDAQYNTRGEQGFYYDSPLGLGTPVPTDMQLSRVYGYTPYMSGWVNFKERSWAGPWVPPDGTPGQNVVAWGPPVAGLQGGRLGRGFGQEATDASAVVVTTDEQTATSAVELLRKHQDRTFVLSILSTLAVASTAALAWWRYNQEQRTRRKKGDSSDQAQSPNPVLGGRRRRRRGR